jgi:hypothetical protein
VLFSLFFNVALVLRLLNILIIFLNWYRLLLTLAHGRSLCRNRAWFLSYISINLIIWLMTFWNKWRTVNTKIGLSWLAWLSLKLFARLILQKWSVVIGLRVWIVDPCNDSLAPWSKLFFGWIDQYWTIWNKLEASFISLTVVLVR